jgi:hypothetical protein
MPTCDDIYQIRLNENHKLLDAFVYILFYWCQIIGVGELLHILQKINKIYQIYY